MKIWLFSDLHLEFTPMPDDFRIPEADICVAAGDILTKGGTRSLEWLNKTIASHMEVVFVPGNHEFYDKSIVSSRERMKELAATMPRVHLLDDSSIRFGDVEFIGATLWSNYKLLGNAQLAAHHAKDKHYGMNDFKYIKYQGNPWLRFSPSYAMSMFRTSLDFIGNALDESTARTKIVVSHHAPSPQSLDENKRTDIGSASYASDLEAFIQEKKPDCWFHGHIHQSRRYRIGSTEIISNPRGYHPEEPNLNFDPGLIIDVCGLVP
jgi:Icc-related predicted phosphoesterase